MWRTPLAWWKQHRHLFPTLSRLARRYFPTPVRPSLCEECSSLIFSFQSFITPILIHKSSIQLSIYHLIINMNTLFLIMFIMMTTPSRRSHHLVSDYFLQIVKQISESKRCDLRDCVVNREIVLKNHNTFLGRLGNQNKERLLSVLSNLSFRSLCLSLHIAP